MAFFDREPTGRPISFSRYASAADAMGPPAAAPPQLICLPAPVQIHHSKRNTSAGMSERCDQFFRLRNGLSQFFRLAAAGLGQIGFAAATASDHGRQRFDN